ncbi:MAG: glycosyltransferase family 4 protein [Rhodothermales bacterium]|nr:glycosyltransferase family 4 protein [Rhodothermales bacterium]MBO6779602.1 glycosyltransferase family 4 protein [Rhodothermales bacterium]
MKRVLYIAYYFPPSGGPGVQRSLKFVRYLPDHGWLPTVVTVDPRHAAWPAVDPTMLAEVPEQVLVRRTGSWDPYAAYARLKGKTKADSVGVGFAAGEKPGPFEWLARFVRANVFLPDARIGWVQSARKAVESLAEAHRYDAVVTSGPPHSSHLVGFHARRKLRLPWLADFRDPWSDLSYYDQLPFLPWSRAADRRLEAKVLTAADRVVTVSDAVAALLRKRGGSDVTVIPNGFDAADFEGVEPRRGDGFRLVYVGTMTEAQNPEAVWRAVAARRAAGQDIRVELVGAQDASVTASLEKCGLTDSVTRRAYVPHREAVAWMKGADLLLLSVPRTAEAGGILTGKVFEYLAAGPPILAVGPRESDLGQLLARSGAGSLVCHGDAEGAGALIDRHYAQPASGDPRDADYLARYSRPVLAGRLAEELNLISG